MRRFSPMLVSAALAAACRSGAPAPAPGAAAPPPPAPVTPAHAETAVARLNASPRHGEWVFYPAGPGEGGVGDSVRAWVVFPERRERAPVVVVIHEIFGLTDWIRAVADQAAAEGFIAIAPDLLSGKGPAGGGTESVDQQGATRLIRTLTPEEVQRRLTAAARYATALPAALPRVTTIGFCWGGSTSFRAATYLPNLRGAVVYYGSSPDSASLASVAAPVLGLYAGDDARVNATIEPARRELARLGKRYEVETYEGAGHGFLRQQTGREGANQRAADASWPRAVGFLREVTR
jgi:carboxymethylenebutenolidase